MSKASSKPSDRGSAEAPARGSSGAWKDWLTLVLGMVLASAGALVANQYEVGRSAMLDFKGARAEGWAEPWPNGAGYRLSYTHPSGTLYGTLYKKSISMKGENRAAITIAYRPSDPQTFQPAGLSYVPGASAVTLFAAGMALILRARNRLTKRIRRDRAHGR